MALPSLSGLGASSSMALAPSGQLRSRGRAQLPRSGAVELIIWMGIIVAVGAAVVALEGARRAQAASRQAREAFAAAQQLAQAAQVQAQAAQRQAEVAERQAAAATERALVGARSVDAAREHLALARQEAGLVGAVDVEWVEQWRHGPVFGLVRVQADGPHTLHDVHLSIVAPRQSVAGVPAVAFLGESPVEVTAAEQRIGIPPGTQATLPSVLHTEVPVGELRPGVPWHAVIMCLSEADSIIFIVDWSVGPARDRERARKNLALPAPL